MDLDRISHQPFFFTLVRDAIIAVSRVPPECGSTTAKSRHFLITARYSLAFDTGVS
jgi:hypothetical protein